VLGLPLEIVPTCDPRDLRPGSPATFRVLFEGKPAPDIEVHARRIDRDDVLIRERTGDAGTVALTLDSPGAWRLNAVQMTELPKGSEQDWESQWASLVLRVDGSP
jgi:uncharacterized GH25 family protein